MSYSARRREDTLEHQKLAEELFINNQPPIFRPFIKIWMRVWSLTYFLVSLITYLGMLVGVGMTAYWSFYSFNWQQALIGGLCTLLIIYVNKVNPK